MLIQDNIALTRTEPNGQGGTQILYRVHDYGVVATCFPKEDISLIQWHVDVVKYHNPNTLNYDLCHSTDLADKTLVFKNDRLLNEFLRKAFRYFEELTTLEGMLDREN